MAHFNATSHESSAVSEIAGEDLLNDSGCRSADPSPRASEEAAARIMQLLRAKDQQILSLTNALRSEEMERNAVQEEKHAALHQFHSIMKENESLQIRLEAADKNLAQLDIEKERLYASVRDASQSGLALKTLQKQHDDMKEELSRQRQSVASLADSKRLADQLAEDRLREITALKQEIQTQIALYTEAQSEFREHTQSLKTAAEQAKKQLATALAHEESAKSEARKTRLKQDVLITEYEKAKNDLSEERARAEKAEKVVTETEQAQKKLNEEHNDLVQRIGTLQSENSILRQQISSLNAEVSHLRRAVSDAHQEDKSVRLELQSSSSERDRLQDEFESLKTSLLEKTKELADSNKARTQLSATVERMRSERDEATHRAKNGEEALKRVHSTIEGATRDYQNVVSKLDDVEEQLLDSQSQLDRLKAENVLLASERDELSQKLRVVTAKASQTQREMSDLCEARLQEAEEAFSRLEFELQRTTADRDSAFQKNREFTALLESKQADIDYLVQSLGSASEKVEKRDRSLDVARTEGDRLREAVEGYRQSREECAQLRSQVKSLTADHKKDRDRLRDADSRMARVVASAKERFDAMEKRLDQTKNLFSTSLRAVAKDAETKRKNDIEDQVNLLQSLRQKEATIVNLQEKLVDLRGLRAASTQQFEIERHAREDAHARLHKVLDENAVLKQSIDKLRQDLKSMNENCRIVEESNRSSFSTVISEAARNVVAVLDAVAEAAESTLRPLLVRQRAFADDLLSTVLLLSKTVTENAGVAADQSSTDITLETTKIERSAASLLLADCDFPNIQANPGLPSIADNICAKLFGLQSFGELAQIAKSHQFSGKEPAASESHFLHRFTDILKKHAAVLEWMLPSSVRGSVRSTLGLPSLRQTGLNELEAVTMESQEVARGVLLFQLRDREQRQNLLTRIEAGIRGSCSLPALGKSGRRRANTNGATPWYLDVSVNDDEGITPLHLTPLICQHLDVLLVSFFRGQY